MGRAIYFFATKEDLESVFAAVEAKRPLKYVRAGMSDQPTRPELTSGTEIPNLGFAPSGFQMLEPFWLITDRDTTIDVEVVPQRRGGVRYCVDNRRQPEAVLMWTGGIYQDSCVINGEIRTGAINPGSMALLNLFVREIRRRFSRIKAFYVGPEAERLLDAGYRLTQDYRYERDRDLTRK